MKSGIGVLGAGAWGTALAVHLANKSEPVALWGHLPGHVEKLKKEKENKEFLPGIVLPSSLYLTDKLEEVLAFDTVLLAVPSHAFRDVLKACQPKLINGNRLLWATKGLDPSNCHFLSEVVQEILGQRSLAILSGPSFALEVAKGLPTAITLASNDPQFSNECVKRFHTNHFRVYSTDDLIGVQLGGVVKNVLAIACGMAEGLGFGSNARSALITRGLAELMRLGKAIGARSETLMGLSGLGDLVLTCTDNQSRNRRFGLNIGQGQNMEQVKNIIGHVVEGVNNARQLVELAKKYHVEMPICQKVHEIFSQHLSPKDAVEELLTRDPKAEI